MNTLIAQPKTIELALEAARNRIDPTGRLHPQKKYIEIIEGVRDSGKPNLDVIAKYKKYGA